MQTHDKHRLETLAVHAGQTPNRRLVPSTCRSFCRPPTCRPDPASTKGFEYSRTHNPTRFALEANLAGLEGGKHGLCFASGCAAATTILHLLSAGDHVIAGDDLYGGTYRIFERVMRQVGIDFTYVDPTDPAAFAAAVRKNTRLIWVETPTNPLLKLCDIAAVAEIAKQHRLILAVDNTFPVADPAAPARSGARPGGALGDQVPGATPMSLVARW